MKKHFFSGIQPSGRLHIGNYLGAISQWIRLQEQYEPVFGIVDLHAMTARYAPQELPDRVVDAAASYLAAGLDPGGWSNREPPCVRESEDSGDLQHVG